MHIYLDRSTNLMTFTSSCKVGIPVYVGLLYYHTRCREILFFPVKLHLYPQRNNFQSSFHLLFFSAQPTNWSDTSTHLFPEKSHRTQFCPENEFGTLTGETLGRWSRASGLVSNSNQHEAFSSLLNGTRPNHLRRAEEERSRKGEGNRMGGIRARGCEVVESFFCAQGSSGEEAESSAEARVSHWGRVLVDVEISCSGSRMFGLVSEM